VLSWAGRIVYTSDSEGYASSSVASPTVTKTRQVSAVGPDNVCSMWGQGGLLYVSANLSKQAYPTIKAWPSRLGVGHEADKPILEKKEAKTKLTGPLCYRRRQGVQLFNIQFQRPLCEIV